MLGGLYETIHHERVGCLFGAPHAAGRTILYLACESVSTLSTDCKWNPGMECRCLSILKQPLNVVITDVGSNRTLAQSYLTSAMYIQ